MSGGDWGGGDGVKRERERERPPFTTSPPALLPPHPTHTPSLSFSVSLPSSLSLSRYENVDGQAFSDLSERGQAEKVKARLKGYSQKVYKATKKTATVERTDTVGGICV